MVKTAARLELERAYRVLVDCQGANDQERQLRAAMRVIAAWEAVSDGLVGVIEKVLDEKPLTRTA